MDAENIATSLEDRAEKLESLASETNIALKEMRIQFETLAEMQKEERIEKQKLHNDEIDKILERHGKEISHWKHICIGLILTLFLILGSIIGCIVYIVTNYEIVTGTYQDLYVGGNGTSTINDGIHINDN